jgi:NAD(P)-dependent dehydrogenase (short-subunit alcohol dehydrogenase family)
MRRSTLYLRIYCQYLLIRLLALIYIHQMRTNFFGAFTCAAAFGRQMLEPKCRGSVVLPTSINGLVATKGMYSSAYSLSKLLLYG